jgi:hypothetical protein
VNLGEQLDGARFVRFDKTNDTVLAWFGGHGCHAYTLDGQEIAYWNIGDFAANSAGFEEVRTNFQGHIESGEYLTLF